MDRALLDSLRVEQKYRKAEKLIRQGLAEDPTDAELWFLLAESLGYQKRLSEQKVAASRSISYNPCFYHSWALLANACSGLGQYEESFVACERALSIAPGLPLAHWLRAHALMAFGEWKEAWASYEYGFITGSRKPRFWGKQWDGSPIPGETLLIWGEQGHGDQIQFARFVQHARKRSEAYTIGEWSAGVLSLLAPLSDMAIAQPPDKMSAVNYDYQCSVWSLPHVMGLETSDIEGDVYLSVPASLETAGKVGICWHGNPKHPNNANRSMPDDCLLTLAQQVPGMVAIQPGATPPEGIERLELSDFRSTASAIAGLKLLISVDTATAHVAGALGIPTIMVAPMANTEARWGCSHSTPWYDSWSIIHQEFWSEVPSAVVEVLNDRFRS